MGKENVGSSVEPAPGEEAATGDDAMRKSGGKVGRPRMEKKLQDFKLNTRETT